MYMELLTQTKLGSYTREVLLASLTNHAQDAIAYILWCKVFTLMQDRSWTRLQTISLSVVSILEQLLDEPKQQRT